ncbi:MAG: hypothetical protein FWF45_07040 [Coriobacteriia bacterium]|nr:hypothetical protein [Coriobacteriia bacterium]
MDEELKRIGDQLLELQEIDTARRKVAEQIDALPQKRIVAALRAKQAEGDQRIKLIEAKIAEVAGSEADLGKDLAAVEARISEEQGHIDEATDHREAAVLSTSLDALAQRKDALENKSLELLQKQQDYENLRTDTEEKIGVLQAREGAEIAAYREQAGALKTELDGLDAQRKAVTDTLPADVLARYDTLVETKGGIVVTRFKKGKCLGCSIVPPTGQRARIEDSDEIEACPQCGRLLVVEQ